MAYAVMHEWLQNAGFSHIMKVINRLKISRLYGRAGSIPAPGTKFF